MVEESKAMATQDSHIIAVDWGSSSFRAYLLNSSWELVDQCKNDHGVLNTSNEFSDILENAITNWLHRYSIRQIIMGGMIGSRNGWIETAYSQCPVNATEHARHAEILETHLNVPVKVLQGVQGKSPCAYPDVMRGEEVQIFGVCQTMATQDKQTETIVCLPGTHSKWVSLQNQAIQSFATLMTGELFAMIQKFSSIGSLITDQKFAKESFLTGLLDQNNQTVTDIEQNNPGLLHSLFSVRARAVSNTLDVESVYSYLSGLLIANEIHTANRLFTLPEEVILVTDHKFKEIYSLALTQLGFKVKYLDSVQAFLQGIRQLVEDC